MEPGPTTDPAPACTEGEPKTKVTADACEGSDGFAQTPKPGVPKPESKNIGTGTSPCPPKESADVSSQCHLHRDPDPIPCQVGTGADIPVRPERPKFNPASLYSRPIDRIPEFIPTRQRRILNLNNQPTVNQDNNERAEVDDGMVSSYPGSTFADINTQTETTGYIPPLNIIHPLPHQAPYQLPQTIPPIIVGPHYVIIFNQNYQQVPPNIMPNFPFAQLRQHGQLDQTNCGVPGCSGPANSTLPGLEYGYSSGFDPNYGFPSFLGPQVIPDHVPQGQPPGFPAINSQLPPLGTTFYPVPFLGQSAATPETTWTETISYQVPVAAAEVEVTLPASTSNGRLNPHAQEYYPRRTQPFQAVEPQAYAGVNLNRSWSDQMESQESTGDHEDPQVPQVEEPVRHSRPPTAPHYDARNTSRRGSSGSSGGGRAAPPRDTVERDQRYTPRGGRYWNNYDEDNRHLHDERDQEYAGYGSYTYRGRGGRGRARGRGRGRGRGGRAYSGEEFQDSSGNYSHHQDTSSYGDHEYRRGQPPFPPRRAETERVEVRLPLSQVPTTGSIPNPAPGQISYASVLSSGFVYEPVSSPRPKPLPADHRKATEATSDSSIEETQLTQPFSEATYVNSSLRGSGRGRGGTRGGGGSLQWTTRQLIEIKTEEDDFPPLGTPRIPASNEPNPSAEKKNKKKGKTGIGDKTEVGDRPTKDHGGEPDKDGGEDMARGKRAELDFRPPEKSPGIDLNDNDVRTKPFSSSNEIDAGDGVGIGTCPPCPNENNSGNTDLHDGAKGEPIQI